MEPKYENEFIKYFFTESEKKEIAAEMAQKIVTLQQTYKSQIDGVQAGINSAATKLTAGCEMRSTKCQVVPNYPKKVLEYVRVDTGALVKEKDMTSNDLQMEFE